MTRTPAQADPQTDQPIPYTLTAMADALLDAEDAQPDDEIPEAEWDSADSSRYQDQLEAAEPEAGIPEGYQGAGPVFAAVELGADWHDLAASGQTTYTVDLYPEPDPDDPGTWAFGNGWAFLDRADAEQAADARTGGQYTRWHGLTGHSQATPARLDTEQRQAQARQRPSPGGPRATPDCPDPEAQ